MSFSLHFSSFFESLSSFSRSLAFSLRLPGRHRCCCCRHRCCCCRRRPSCCRPVEEKEERASGFFQSGKEKETSVKTKNSASLQACRRGRRRHASQQEEEGLGENGDSGSSSSREPLLAKRNSKHRASSARTRERERERKAKLRALCFSLSPSLPREIQGWRGGTARRGKKQGFSLLKKGPLWGC